MQINGSQMKHQFALGVEPAPIRSTGIRIDWNASPRKMDVYLQQNGMAQSIKNPTITQLVDCF